MPSGSFGSSKSSSSSVSSSSSSSSGCCNPSTITISWSYIDYSLGGILKSYTETLSINSQCYYERTTPTSCYYYTSPVEYITVSYGGGVWTASGGNECFASIEGGDGTSTDPCDPTGTYTITDPVGNPTGRTWTVS